MAFIDGTAGQLYYEITDLTPPWLDDPPVVVFHHGLGFTADIWAEWLPLLVDRFRIVRFDMLGSGRSTIPEAGHAWSFAGLAQDILSVAAAAGATRRFHFIGESFGGIMGYYLAIAHPEHLRTVVSVTASHQGGWIGGNVRDWRRQIEEDGIAAWSAGMLESRFRPGSISPELHAWLDRMQKESARDVIIEVSGGLLRTMDLKPDLSKISVPILLLVGDASPFVPVEALCDIRKEIGHAELHVIAGARHGVVISHPRECAEVFRQFVDRHADP